MGHSRTRFSAISLLSSSLLTGSLLGGAALLGACGPDGNGGVNENGEPIVCDKGDSQACYSGSEATEGVGPCHGGTQTCQPDGTWGPCEGEYAPTDEICENGIDDNCNGTVDEDQDLDGDGFTVCQNDCCDTTDQCSNPALVNPGAVEVVSEDGSASADENCNGMVDEPPPTCDTTLALDDTDPVKAAAAIDICADATFSPYGLVSAKYTRANGAAFTPGSQAGLQPSFGPNVPPRLGSGMLALSTGAARSTGQPSACGTQSCPTSGSGTAPAGFPQDVPNCAGSSTINDDVALELTLKAPVNATGYSFDFMFYSFEYPEYVCSSFNDQFVAIVDPAPEGAINGNIAFDSMTNPVSVNIAFFDICEGCQAGTAELEGTGFDTLGDAGATTWLRTQAPVEPGAEFTIRFMIWDTGDRNLDSTVLIDNFRWLGEPVEIGTKPID